jgi:hypothetical protein
MKLIDWFKKKDTAKEFSFGKAAAQFDPKARTLKAATYMVDVPDPPEEYSSFDNMTVILKKTVEELLPIDHNDTVGNCVVAGWAHILTMILARLGILYIPDADAVLAAYKKLKKCGEDGLVMLDFLKYLRKHGVLGHKINAFGRVDFKNHKLVKQCIWLFGGLDLGFIVQRDAISDFKAGIPWTPGPSDGGGHCVIAGAYKPNLIQITGYDSEGLEIATWGGKQKVTWAWWDAQLDECFVIFPPEAMQPGFMVGFNSDQLLVDFIAATTV